MLAPAPLEERGAAIRNGGLMTQPTAGWFPDPSDPSRQRYFDGRTWTENYAPFAAPTPGNGLPAKPGKPGMSRGAKIVLGVGAAILALIVLGSIGNSDKKTSSSSSSQRGNSSAPLASPATPPSPEDNFTPGQKNAFAKAKSYLSHSAFSKQGLIEQLVYSQFSQADAVFAVDYIEASGDVDWNEQAVKKAQSYLSHSSFSLQGLIDQLEYSGFTPAEAQYGANTAYGG